MPQAFSNIASIDYFSYRSHAMLYRLKITGFQYNNTLDSELYNWIQLVST
jgi:hypothetical protein